jgi:hypothetical protein
MGGGLIKSRCGPVPARGPPVGSSLVYPVHCSFATSILNNCNDVSVVLTTPWKMSPLMSVVNVIDNIIDTCERFVCFPADGRTLHTKNRENIEIDGEESLRCD